MTIKDEIMQDVVKDIVDSLQYEIELDGLVFTGQLKNSWQTDKESDGSYTIGSPLLWAVIMDEGRIPGKAPPAKALIPWVFQKLGAKNEQDLKSKAFAVAQAIGKKGIEPRHYIKRALFRMESETA